MSEKRTTIVMIASAIALALIAQHFGVNVADARFAIHGGGPR